MTRNRVSLSLITPAYNNAEEVRKLLASVPNDMLKDHALEVIVVDDCSSDDAVKRVGEESGFAKYIRLDKNSGPAEARNAGARHARNDILVFVDSDVILNKETLSRIKDTFENNESVAILGGEYDVEPANPTFFTKFKSLMVSSWRPKEDIVTVFLTRLGAIKKSVFDELGGFDTNLKTAAVEDYEFGRRLTDKGYIIYYDSTVTVKHHFPTFRQQIKLFFHRSFMWIYIFKKYRGFDNTCTTPLSGVTQLCGFLSILALFGTVLNAKFIYAALFFCIVFIAGNLRFLKLVLEHEGILFALIAIPLALIISCSIVAGCVYGTIYYYIYEEFLKRNA